VPFARLNDYAVGLSKDYVAEPEHFIQAAGHCKNFRVGGDSDHAAQDLWRHAITPVAVDHAVKPGPAGLMVGGIRSESVH